MQKSTGHFKPLKLAFSARFLAARKCAFDVDPSPNETKCTAAVADKSSEFSLDDEASNFAKLRVREDPNALPTALGPCDANVEVT